MDWLTLTGKETTIIKNNNMKTEISKFSPCREAVEFRSKYKNFQDAWENCERGDWMLWIASKAGVNKRKLTLAKALCAETVKHLMKDDRSLNAIKVAKRYGMYRADENKLNNAAAAAYTAAYVAATADAASDATSDAAVYTAAYAAAKKQNQLATAEICRKILSKHVFRLINKNQ